MESGSVKERKRVRERVTFTLTIKISPTNSSLIFKIIKKMIQKIGAICTNITSKERFRTPY